MFAGLGFAASAVQLSQISMVIWGRNGF
ncbi:MAG: hypothetical protein HC941_31825 [Microcoleus sp. SU_5_3]|nr:hypothetical protein [Microcoleus sp. SU_5_3]